MPVYTHNFEVKIDGIVIEGEILFDHGHKTAIKTTSGEEMTVKQHGLFQNLLENLAKFHCDCAGIEKIEVLKKP